jgi:carboxyl-terminal processing protease
MNPTSKSLLAAGAVVLSCVAVLAGTRSRDNVDSHLSSFNYFLSTRKLLASTSNSTPAGDAGDYYEFVSELLQRDYVDPVNDERKMSTGAVRGMVGYLDDPDCRFMDAEEFKSFSDEANGRFQGIGIQLGYEEPSKKQLQEALPDDLAALSKEKPSAPTADSLDDEGNYDTGHLPAVVVESVVPGSPADKAGVKVGDSVNSVDGLWVLNPYEINALGVITPVVYSQTDKVAPGTTPSPSLVKLTSQLLTMRRALRQKLKASLTPSKAIDRLTMGTGGPVKVVWERGRNQITTEITKAASNEDAVTKGADGVLAVHFQPGLASKLKSEIGGGAVTLDLRNNRFGDPSELRPCLELFGQAGTYGKLVNYKGKTSKPLETSSGSKPRALKLIVDRSTSGVAEMFALALQAKGYAKVEGPSMSPDRNMVETVKLSDGSGYTLVTGKYDSGAELTGRKS